jgi:hypothetical protein
MFAHYYITLLARYLIVLNNSLLLKSQQKFKTSECKIKQYINMRRRMKNIILLKKEEAVLRNTCMHVYFSTNTQKETNNIHNAMLLFGFKFVYL